MDTISVLEKTGANYVLLEIAGTVNSYTYTEFQNRAYSLVKKTNLVLDMSKVVNISSAGLGVLIAATEDAKDSGFKLYLMNPSEIVRTAIESTGFREMFTIIHSLTEVL